MTSPLHTNSYDNHLRIPPYAMRRVPTLQGGVDGDGKELNFTPAYSTAVPEEGERLREGV